MSQRRIRQQERFSIAGKLAVVTGGHRGIGRDISLGLAQAGADVVVIDKSGSGTSDVPRILRELGRRYWCVRADLASTMDITAAVEETRSLIKPRTVDILVNNAGVSYLAPLEELSLTHWDMTMAVNARTPFLLSQAFANGENGMLARKSGVIVNLSSVSGKIAIDKHGAYCASKGALDMLTKVMAAEWGSRGIRANGVAPTVVLTEMGARVWSGAEGNTLRARIPQKRFVEPHEVADAVVFLASDAASMINGEILTVDGGLTIV